MSTGKAKTFFTEEISRCSFISSCVIVWVGLILFYISLYEAGVTCEESYVLGCGEGWGGNYTASLGNFSSCPWIFDFNCLGPNLDQRSFQNSVAHKYVPYFYIFISLFFMDFIGMAITWIWMEIIRFNKLRKETFIFFEASLKDKAFRVMAFLGMFLPIIILGIWMVSLTIDACFTIVPYDCNNNGTLYNTTLSVGSSELLKFKGKDASAVFDNGFLYVFTTLVPLVIGNFFTLKHIVFQRYPYVQFHSFAYRFHGEFKNFFGINNDTKEDSASNPLQVNR